MTIMKIMGGILFKTAAVTAQLTGAILFAAVRRCGIQPSGAVETPGGAPPPTAICPHFAPEAPKIMQKLGYKVIIPGAAPAKNRISGAIYTGDLGAAGMRKLLRNKIRRCIIVSDAPSRGDAKLHRDAVFLTAHIGEFAPAHIADRGKFCGFGRRRWTAHFGAAQKLSKKAKNRRTQARQIADSLESIAALPEDENIARAFLRWGGRHGWARPLFSDAGRPPLSYRQTFRAAWALGGALAARGEANIGVMLPSSAGAAAVFYAAAFWNLTPVFLNPAGGRGNLLSARRTASVQTIYTSQKLLDNLAAAKTAADALRADGAEIICLEDLRKTIGIRAKVGAVFAAALPSFSIGKLPGAAAKSDSPAAVLFTSGSEGKPKGAVLGHGNLAANAAQVLARLGGMRGETMLNSLPVFHSFGLLAGVVLPAAAGMHALQYPSPLHYRQIPETIRRQKPSVFFSADSFLAAYAREAHPLDMQSLRRVFAGAEKLKESTRRKWAEKFGVRILEGYGVTETSPVISVNAPSENRPGGVGRPLANIEIRLSPVEGVPDGGRLHVRGPNVMLGYLYPNAPGKITPPPDGRHDTGDIAKIDGGGFLHIIGRARRFVKISGEMAPLDGIEETLQNIWTESRIAVVGVADKKRGEQIAALSDNPKITREKIAAEFHARGISPLWTPRAVLHVKEIPLLSAGKTDYPAAQKIAETHGEPADML